MAIAKVVYKESSTATPSTWMDVTQKTVTSATMLSSITALKNDGTNITGTIATKSVGNLWFSSSTATFGVPAGYYSGTGAIYWTIASKGAETFVPAETAQTISSYQWLTGSQTIAPISSTYVGSGVPTIGATTIYPSTSAQVAVSSGAYTTGDITVGAVALQSKTVTPTESAQTITPDTNSSSAVPTGATMLSSNPMVTTIDLSFLEYGNTYHVTGGFYCTNNYRESDCRVNFDTVWTASENGEIEFTLESGASDDPSRITLSKTQLKIYYPDGTTIIRGAIGSAMSEYNTLTFTDLSDSYIGLSSVTVGAISSTYVGTGVATKAAATIYPSTAQQTIASQQYLTGTQTFAPVTTLNLEASYIASGITVKVGDSSNASRIANVTGTLQGAESFAAIYKSLANRQMVYSSAYLVSEWCDSLTSISSYQFAGQGFTGNFTFANVSKIGLYAFGAPYINQGALQGNLNITFPNLSELSNGAVGIFIENGTLKKAAFPKVSSLTSYMFASCGISSVLSTDFQACSVIGSYAFAECHYLSTVSFTECSTIGGYAFHYCDRLSSISFPMCTLIENAVFDYCIKLPEAYFPECSEIGWGTFRSCSSLTTVSFPKCKIINNQAFISCSVLNSISFPECTLIGGYAFQYCSALLEASFPECSLISNSAFYSCGSLTTIYFPKCSLISSFAFCSCKLLTEASFPECSCIGSAAFSGCYSLSNIYFPKCSIISGNAFYSCSLLTEVSFPNCISISNYAFNYCTKLESAYFTGSSIVSAGINMFMQTPIHISTYLGHFGSIYVPSSLVDSYKTATNWTQYSNRIVGI